MIPQLTQFANDLIADAKVNPIFTAGLVVLAVVFILLAIQGLRRPQ